MNDFRQMTTEELNVKLTGLKTELFNLRFSHATGQLTNPLLLNTTKKDIARVKTIIRERELSAKK
jgi:large subunit ribosomal protein L29